LCQALVLRQLLRLRLLLPPMLALAWHHPVRLQLLRTRPPRPLLLLLLLLPWAP
jgi:hypothetical protein